MNDNLYRPLSDFSFDTTRHLEPALQLNCIRLCAYLLALAAIQRNLRVEFLGSTEIIRKKIRETHRSATQPRLLRILDETKSHLFDFTSGDLTTAKVARLCDNKMRSKILLWQCGIGVPVGRGFNRNSIAAAERFLKTSKSKRFLIKPIFGSLSIGVARDLDNEEALRHIAALDDDAGYILEEYIHGKEYRAYVVGDKVAGALQRCGAYIVGDGFQNIKELLEVRNRNRLKNPEMKNQLIDVDGVKKYLKNRGITMSSVPELGKKVRVGDGMRANEGGVNLDRYGSLPENVAAAAIRACSVLGAPNAGVDLIESAGSVYVLEVNHRAGIGLHSFPEYGEGSRNNIAEAIVDLYFPETKVENKGCSIGLSTNAINAAFSNFGAMTLHRASQLSL